VSLRILLVDDSETTRRILRVLLGSREWAICGEAENGCSGIELFEQLRPDLAVLDLAMPDMNGIEAAKVMSVIDSQVPIILFTIFGFDGLETSATAAGIRAIVPKENAWSLIPRIEDLARREQTIN